MSKGPNIKRVWISKFNSNITAESAEEAEALRVANPNNPNYEVWLESKELNLIHDYVDENPSTKPNRVINDNKV